MTPVLHIRLLGDCSLDYDGEPVAGVNTPRLQSLLAYLLLHRDAPQSRSHVAFQFWPDSTESQAHSNLRTLLHRLRQVLPGADQFLLIDGQTLQWRPEAPYILDVAGFEQALARAEQEGDWAEVRPVLEQSIELYGGELLPSCYDDWILPEREWLHQAYLRAMEALIQVLEEAREYDKAIRYAQRLLRDDPLHEAAYRRLMRLRALSGDRAGALRVYHDCVTILQRELGVEPSPATQRAYERVLQVEARSEPESQVVPAVSPLVGREEEWAQLQTAWQRSARGPRIVLVLGEAGIGKTRLVEELLHWAERQGIESAYARCYAAAGERAYAPVMALLRARPMPALDDAWLSEVARLLPEVRAERPDLAPARPMTESWQRQHLLEALARAALGNRQPLLLAIDDLHWCDRDTLDWLHFLLCFDPGARLLVVGTCRPEELDEDCPLAAMLPLLYHDVRVSEIELGSLDSPETAALAANVAGEQLVPPMLDLLYRETEGNPLFVVEMVRAGVEGGVWELTVGDGIEQSVVEPSMPRQQVLPPRVHAVLAARLNRLSPPARDLAGLAATIGRAFTFPVLREATDGDESTLVLGLDELWQRRIVRERGVAAYDFAHDKLREVVYAALSPARRRLLHRRVAEALEAAHDSDPDAIARQMAVHYDRAGLPEQAIPYYLRAGEVACGIYAGDEAEASFRRGLALLTEGAGSLSQEAWRRGTAARLNEGLGDVLRASQPEEARMAYRNALQGIHEEDLLAQARLRRKIAFDWVGQGQFDRALLACDVAETILGLEPFEPVAGWWQEWLEVQNQRLTLYYCTGRWLDMAHLLDRMRRTVEQYGSVWHQSWFRQGRALMALRRDRYLVSDKTLADSQASFEAGQQSGDRFWLAHCHYHLGMVQLLRGDLVGAGKDLRIALALADQTGNLWTKTYALTWLALLCRKQGQVQEAQGYAARGLSLATTIQQLDQVGLAKAIQAWVAWREGELPESEALGQAALQAWQRSQWVYAFQWTALWPLLAMALNKSDLPTALDHARALLDPQQQQLPRFLEAALESAVGEGEDQMEAVRVQLEQAAELAQKLGFV